MPENRRIEIFGVERAAKGEWWDLFCSKECVAKIYGDADDAEYLYDTEKFNRETGGIFERCERFCFACNTQLAPEARAASLQRIAELNVINSRLRAEAISRGLIEEDD